MIRPDKHMNLQISIISISAFILQNLKKGQQISYANLQSKTMNKLGVDAKKNFPYALNFLFLLGKIIYISESDSFSTT